MKKRNQAGYTLLEVAVASMILAVMIGAAITAMQANQRLFNESVSNGNLNQKTNRAVNRIAQAVTGAGMDTITLSAQFDVLTFQEVSGWVGGVATWSNDVEIRLQYEPGELDNNTDDDGDGYVDECQVILTENLGQPNQTTVVLLNSVREFLEGEVPDGADNNDNLIDDERGLCFELLGDTVIIHLTLQRTMPEGGIGLRSLSTAVGLRN